MPQFRYKVVTPAGEEVEGALEAVTRAAAIDRLRRDGHTPIRAEEISGRPSIGRLSKTLRSSRQLSQADIILLTRELATLLQAGLPLERALTVTSELSPEGPQQRFVQTILNAVRGGATLADAMSSPGVALPAFYLGMVRAGEAGGTLDSVLAQLADALERAQALRESIRSALYYPIIVVIVAVLTLVVLLTAVVPEFRPLFEDSGKAMPLPMMALLEAGDFLKHWWWGLLLLIVVFVFGVRHYSSRSQGRLWWDGWLSRAPLIGDLLVKIEVARFARTLGTLLANGVTTLQAFSIAVGAIGNRAIARRIDTVTSRLKRGEGLATPLRETGVFPQLAAQLVQV